VNRICPAHAAGLRGKAKVVRTCVVTELCRIVKRPI